MHAGLLGSASLCKYYVDYRGRDNLNVDAVLLRFATNDRDPDVEVVLAFIVRLRNDVFDIGAGTVIMPECENDKKLMFRLISSKTTEHTHISDF